MMYQKNDIIYASESGEDIRVRTVKALPYHMLLLTFTTGEKRLFDGTALEGGAFAPLADEAVFRTAAVFHGAVTWLDGEIDCAPEYLYENSFAYEEDPAVYSPLFFADKA